MTKHPEPALDEKGLEAAAKVLHCGIWQTEPNPTTERYCAGLRQEAKDQAEEAIRAYFAATPAEVRDEPGAVSVDAIAQEIRRVDGENSLGAGALAEALMPFLSASPRPASQAPATPPAPVPADCVLVPRIEIERVIEIANRNEQSPEGDRLAVRLSALTVASPPQSGVVEALREAREIVDACAGLNVPAQDWAHDVLSRVDAALAALAAIEEQAGWRTIDTAPPADWTKDEKATKALLYGPDVGVRSGEVGNFHGHLFGSIPTLHGNAVEDWGVTHWMPLPTSPKQETNASEGGRS